jgi:hypothetical protein
MRIRRAAFILGLIFGAALGAQADTVLLGVPVSGIGGTQSVPNCPTLEGQSCYNATTGAITFFIPLKPSTSGIFGVTPVTGGTAGTFADTGYGTANALTMYLMFAPVGLPVQSATLTFSFVDLDLAGVNDPAQFFERVKFIAQDGTALTDWITTNGQSGSSPLAFTVSGNSTSQTIYFPDVTSIMANPFYVELQFGSQWNQKGTNTPETLTATLVTTPIPEPGTLTLVATGLAGAALSRRRRKA